MANRKVAVYKQVRVGGVWDAGKREWQGGVWVKCPPWVNPSNNKPENDKVLVRGKMEVHPEGDWGIFFYEGTKRRWKKIGPKYNLAKNAADIKELALRGLSVGLKVEEADEKTLLKTAIASFLDPATNRPSAKWRPKTLALFTYDLEEFRRFVKKQYVEDLTSDDLHNFVDWIVRTPEQSDREHAHKTRKLRTQRTAVNKVAEVNQFYRWFMDLPPGKGLVKMEEFRDDDENDEPIIFQTEELEKFFAACKPAEHLLFTTFLRTGLRKGEMMNLAWRWVDLRYGIITVRNNKTTGHKTKTGKSRTIPILPDLLLRLTAHKEAATKLNQGADTDLVFCTRSGKPNDKMWDLCKKIAKRSGQDPSIFFVHRFRATYATNCLRGGMDVKSVQVLLGHSHKDFTSTSRYLAAAVTGDLKERFIAAQAKAGY
ncbi:tyrosine-type recombinase/integrase [Granulicella tundricola]|uniref:Integrase family protein n=1 Tax=Granulicella tundricola (strain ATCC BAA-1859 / DSM 23138 / MP5ACTX9) TaxID=1198114 RepID=E8X175_GRATM|nr:site-specific integrase [Granulicella tundricola]ADW69029.1 integrase family protein [Granulicella tundricola MP5ACTX9]